MPPLITEYVIREGVSIHHVIYSAYSPTLATQLKRPFAHILQANDLYLNYTQFYFAETLDNPLVELSI